MKVVIVTFDVDTESKIEAWFIVNRIFSTLSLSNKIKRMTVTSAPRVTK